MRAETKRRIIEQVEKTPIGQLSPSEIDQWFELKFGRKQKYRVEKVESK